MSDPTAADPQPPRGPSADDDPGAMARADVRAILARALGLRRIVELAAETARDDPSRARSARPGRSQSG